MVKPCLVYLRVSSEDQNPENQLSACLGFARDKLGYDEGDIDVVTEKISAFKNPDREIINSFYSRETVVAWRYDRIQRNKKAFVELMRASLVKGTRIYSVQEAWLMELLYKVPAPWNEMFFDFIAQMIGWFAEDESRKISERTKAGLARCRAEGKMPVRNCRVYDFERVWREYQDQGSINRASKVLPYSFSIVRFIINNDIHDQDTYVECRRAETERRRLAKMGGV